MKRLSRGVLLLLAVAVVYLALLPATWFDKILQDMSQGTLAMTATTGTLWRGGGRLQALLPRGEAVTLAPVNWEISLFDLLTLHLHLTVRSSQGDKILLEAIWAPGSAAVREASLDLPAALLGALSPTLREADLSGQIALQAHDIRVEGGHATGKAQAIWIAAGSGLSRVRPLGNYQLDLAGKGTGLDMRLSSLGGALALDGSGRWIPGVKTSYRIVATPTESKRQELAPLLRMLGNEITPGKYQLTIDGNVRALSR